MNSREFEEFVRKNPDEARRLVSKAFRPSELLTVGNRSYRDAYRNPETRIDFRDLDPPDMLQPMVDPLKLLTDKYVIPPSQLLFKSGGLTYRKNWWGQIAGGVVSSATVIQNAINTLIGIGGKIFIKGDYTTPYIINTLITIPSTIYPSNILFEGEGVRSTHLRWNPSVAGTRMFDADGAAADEGHLIGFKELRLSGGDAATQQVTALRVRRTLFATPLLLSMDHVFITYCADPAIEADYLQNSYIYGIEMIANAGWDIDSINASHFQMYGGYVAKQRLSNTTLKSFGVSREHVEIRDNPNYSILLSGDVFDPVATGYGSHIKIGTESVAEKVVLDGLAFIGEPEAGSYFIDVERGLGIDIRLSHYLTTFAGTYINLQDEAEHCTVVLPADVAYARVVNAGLSNLIQTIGKREPWISRIFDDFYGPTLDNKWGTVGTVAVNFDVAGGAADLTTPAVLNGSASITTSARKPMITSLNPVAEMRSAIDIATFYTMELRIQDDLNNLIRLRLDTNVAQGGACTNILAGVVTTTNFNHTHDTEFHTLRIEACPTRIKYFVDEDLKATHTTNISTTLSDLSAVVLTRDATPAARTMYLDYLDGWQQR